MDIHCKKCGEPFGVYYLRHEAEEGTYERVMSGAGCPACKWGKDAPKEDHTEEYLRSLSNTDDDPTKYL